MKPMWPWTQRIVQRFCSDSKSSSLPCSSTLPLMPVDRLLNLCTWEIQTSSQPELWLQTNMTLLAYTTLNCYTSVSETGFTLVWALYPSRFRQHLCLLHQQQKYASIIILIGKASLEHNMKLGFDVFIIVRLNKLLQMY